MPTYRYELSFTLSGSVPLAAAIHHFTGRTKAMEHTSGSVTRQWGTVTDFRIRSIAGVDTLVGIWYVDAQLDTSTDVGLAVSGTLAVTDSSQNLTASVRSITTPWAFVI